MVRILTTLLLLLGSSYAATFNVSTTDEFRQALLDAAGNEEDDIINFSEGMYKTTDDSGGTFVYFEQNYHSLELQGNNSILDGGSADQILKASSGVLTIKDLTFQNGNSDSDGGAISCTSAQLKVYSSSFINNEAALSGGSIYATDGLIVDKSEFRNNHANGFTAIWANGGAIFFDSTALIENSSFIDNNSSGSTTRTGGMSIYGNFDSSLTVNNSIFKSNNTDITSAHISILRGYLNVVNSLFYNSETAIGLYADCTAKVYNSTFHNIQTYNFIADDDGKISIYNSYADITKKYGNFLFYQENTIFDGVNLGFVDESNGDYHLTVNSDLIDSGVDSADGIEIPITDFDNNPRPSGVSTDIGPYEYQFLPIPTDVTASDGTFEYAVSISWSEISSTEYYNIYRSESQNEIGDTIGGTTSISFLDDTIEENIKYYYRVNACNDEGCSDYSVADSGYIGKIPPAMNPAIIMYLLN